MSRTTMALVLMWTLVTPGTSIVTAAEHHSRTVSEPDVDLQRQLKAAIQDEKKDAREQSMRNKGKRREGDEPGDEVGDDLEDDVEVDDGGD